MVKYNYALCESLLGVKHVMGQITIVSKESWDRLSNGHVLAEYHMRLGNIQWARFGSEYHIRLGNIQYK